MARSDLKSAEEGPVAGERPLVQRLDALQRANVIRTRRAELKRDLKAGRVSFADVILSPPDFAETAKVFDLLLAVPQFGRVRANKVLQSVRISPSKTVGGLSDRQRIELVDKVEPGRRPRGTPVPSGNLGLDRFANEVARLAPMEEVDTAAVEHAARAVAARSAWDAALGPLLDRQELLNLLDLDGERFAALLDSGNVVTLTDRSGVTRFPAFQFVDGGPNPALTAAHRVLIREGHVNPWSAAAWLMAPHPDLEGRTPAQWASEHRGDRRAAAGADALSAPPSRSWCVVLLGQR
jgi:hypothetical protein